MMTRKAQSLLLVVCLALGGCSSDPATFLTYVQQKKAVKPTDALALEYANSVETRYRARSTGARFTREGSDTGLAGLATVTAAAKSLAIGAAGLSSMGLASGGIIALRTIFDAKGRATAYGEASVRIHGSIKDYVAHNLNAVSPTDLTPNGWTLANVVQSNIDIVNHILNGHLPTPQDLEQASEPMSESGAKTQSTGTTPRNNIATSSLASPTMNSRLRAAAGLQTIRVNNDAAELARLRKLLAERKAQTPNLEKFSAMMNEIDDLYPDSETDQTQKAQLKAAYTALLEDSVLKNAKPSLPVIAPDGNAIITFFQKRDTSDDQKQKLMTAASNQVKRLKPKQATKP